MSVVAEGWRQQAASSSKAAVGGFLRPHTICMVFTSDVSAREVEEVWGAKCLCVPNGKLFPILCTTFD